MTAYRIYLDTSVIGGLFDDEFAVATKALFERIAAQELTPVVSDVTDEEISGAPQFVRDAYANLKSQGLEFVLTTPEAVQLAAQYEAMKILSAKSRNDMLHIAIATLAKVDAIVSWNFKHIVNFDKMHLFNGVNQFHGHLHLAIHSPLEFAK